MEADRQEPGGDDAFDAVFADLERRHRRLGGYLLVRAALGVGLMIVGVGSVGVALAFVAAASGWLEVEALTRWTVGFGAVLAPVMPGFFGLICVRTGWAWWRHRRPDTAETGCLAS